MADEPNEDVLDLTEEDQVEEEQQTEQQSEQPDDGEEETILQFGDEEAAPASGEAESSVLRDLRKRYREATKRIEELEKGQPAQTIEVGEKPTLASCEYDEERFEAELDAWKSRKADAERQKSETQRQQEAAQAEFAKDVERYQSLKAQVPGANEAEEVVSAALNIVQRATIIKAANNPALLEAALAKFPDKLAELSKIQDPIKLAAAAARMEAQVKVTKRKKAPAPEEIAHGNASAAAGGPDKELERLEKEAERTGDRSKIIAYKRSLRQA